jgi:cell division protein FtsB
LFLTPARQYSLLWVCAVCLARKLHTHVVMITTLRSRLELILQNQQLPLIPPVSWSKIKSMKALLEARKKILGAAAIALLFLLMMNLNSRLSEYFHLDNERNKMQTQVSNLERTRSALETRVAFATSDQAVEEWARNEAHMAQPGDVVVVQLTPANQTPEAKIVEVPTPRPIENWEVWWALFFGD